MSYNSNQYNKTSYNYSSFVPSEFSGTLFTFRQDVHSTAATQSLFDLKQKVGVLASAQVLITLKQQVELQSIISNKTLFTTKQKVNKTLDSQDLFTLVQRVNSTATQSGFFEKYGWDCEVIVGGYRITTDLVAKQNGLHGKMTISVNENQSRTATFTIIPPEASIDPQQFQGQQVIINMREASTGWYKVFTGWVDVPEIDFLQRKVTFICTDRRADRIIKLGSEYVNSIGSYSEDVFGRAQDKADELDKRLETVPSTVDFDNYGNVKFTPWRSKTVADFTLGNSDVFYSNVNVRYTNRAKTINRINLTLNYNYERLHQQVVGFTWTEADYTPNSQGLQNWFNNGKGSFAGKETIKAAASQGAWKLLNMSFVDLWPAQSVPLGEGFGVWQPNQVYEETKGREQFLGYLKDNNGDFVTAGSPAKLVPIYEPVLDANGKQIQDVIRRVITDTSSHLCIGASWTSARRFTQTVTEKYQVQITAPQLISKFGAIDSYDQVDITDEFDSSYWENSDVVSLTNENFFIDKDTQRYRYLQAMQVMLNRARTNLLKVSRDVVVNFRTKFLKPQLDLYHTVEIDVDDKLPSDSGDPHFNAKGKIGSYQHVIDFDSTEAYTDVTLYLSKADGSTTDTTQFAILVPPQDPSYIGSKRTISLGTHLGEDPNPDNTPGAENWTGYIGNKLVGNIASGQVRTNYPESFVVVFPEISGILRDNIVYTSPASSNTFTILIPDDTLDVSF